MLGKALSKIDRGAAKLSSAAVRLLVWPVLYSMCVGAALYGTVFDERLTMLLKNKLLKPQRIQGLLFFAAALGTIALIYVIVIGVRRWRKKEWATAETTHFLNRLFAFLIATPFVGALMTPNIQVTDPKLTLVYVVVATAACVPTLIVLTPDEERRRLPERFEKLAALGSRYGALAAVVIAFTAYAWFFSKLAVTHHHALSTRTIDLGYYDNIFYQSAHGRPLACSFLRGGTHVSAHFDPILVVLSPIYMLRPRAETILTLQSVWLAIGVFPAYLLGKHALQSRAAGLVVGATYLLHPALHGPNLYEFHSLTLVAMPMLWALYFLETKRFKSYWATFVVLLLVREDVSLLLAFVGIYALLRNEDGQARVGWATLLLCVAYFFGVKRLIMTSPDILNDGTGAYGFSYYFKDMIPAKGGMRGLLTSLVTNPAFVFKHIFSEPKIEYLMKMFIPVLALPFFAKPARFMLLYGLTFTLLATRKPVYQTGFQYSLILLPIIVAIAPQGLARLRDGRAPELLGISKKKLVAAALWAMLFSSLLTSWKFGAIVDNPAFRGGFARLTRTLNEEQATRYEHVKKMVAMIEPGAGVTVTNKMGPHVSNRQHVYFYRQKKVKESHYVFVDERDLKKKVRAWHLRRVARGELEELHAYKTFKLFRFHPELEKAEPKKPKPTKSGKAGRPKPGSKRKPERPPPRPKAGELIDDRDSVLAD